MKIEEIKILAEIIQSVSTTIGITIAGLWSFWLFRFSRAFAGTISISSSLSNIIDIDGALTIIVEVKIKNIGRTRVKKGYCFIAINELQKPFSSNRIYPIGVEAVDYTEAREILNSLVEIEPNEEFQDEIVFVLNKAGLFKIGVKFRRKNSHEIWESLKIFHVIFPVLANTTSTTH